jgi:hypothetical protein
VAGAGGGGLGCPCGVVWVSADGLEFDLRCGGDTYLGKGNIAGPIGFAGVAVAPPGGGPLGGPPPGPPV